MIFKRSASGVSNYKFMHRVDFIVYSEGGNAEILKTDPDKFIYSIDSEFWGALFEKSAKSSKIKIKSLGAKNNVLPYAKDIFSGTIKNSIVVLDKDHDEHKGVMIEHPLVIYTNGYSWENDAWSSAPLIKVLSEKHPEKQLSAEKIANILDRYKKFETTIRRLVFVDIICSCHDIECIPNKFGSVINIFNGAPPLIIKKEFLNIIKSAKRSRKSPIKYHGRRKIYPLADCYGKLFAEFAYGILTQYYKEITGKSSIGRDHADQLMAKALAEVDHHQEGMEIAVYYRKKISTAINHLTRRQAA
ncbi:DUF4435 domain-containing protein [Pseudomonas cichorii]|uniref:DUF4435 domain-containing protein n=1 Tax=Pseudomonas cichorii TaxID=36746 RepID=A0A3M4W7G0_PSECI|nr:DUF4435 domain-containing protein [Pseudomonas cichorii]RMR60088.1 hypothetical protein ALP84_01374 [Pseudomonas cichorii]